MGIQIIGAGIGGLSTAIALQQKGVQSTVYEQAKELKPVGAGIILANNAMQVYDRLGLKDRIVRVSNPVRSVNITDTRLKVISSVDLQSFERKYGVENRAIHRGQLQHILVEALGDSQIILDSHLDFIAQYGDQVSLNFSNGKSVQSTLVIGADGIHSNVRKHIFPRLQLRNADQICWRGIASLSLPEPFHDELNEAWGGACRFGFVRLSTTKVYWYALVTKEDDTHITMDNLSTIFDTFHPLVKDLFQATDPTEIHEAEIQDLEPNPTWVKGNIVLIGDAAHATTPNIGQGACQAIEDAYLLATALHRFDTKDAFTIFQRARTNKVNRIVKASWRLGQVAHWKNPLAVFTRNIMMQTIPSFLNKKQTEFVFKLNEVE